MSNLLTYLLWPNPPAVPYDNQKIIILLVLSFGLIAVSFTLRMWRKRLTNAVTKRLSRSWPRSLLWFGIAGVILTMARVEQISYVSMRLWWGVWLLLALVYLFFQIKFWRMRYYKKLPSKNTEDPRAKYLPRRKKRRN